MDVFFLSVLCFFFLAQMASEMNGSGEPHVGNLVRILESGTLGSKPLVVFREMGFGILTILVMMI